MKCISLVMVAALAGCSTARHDHLPAFAEVTDYQPGTIISAMPVETHPPRFPVHAVKECLGGLVEVVIAVDADGFPQQIDVIHSEPGDLFVKNATDALLKWRFKVPMNEGVAVPSLQRLPLEFSRPRNCGSSKKEAI